MQFELIAPGTFPPSYMFWFAANKNDPNGYYTECRFVPLSRPEGIHVCLPVMNYSPLTDCYLLDSLHRVLVWDQPAETPSEYPGKITGGVVYVPHCSQE